jgi:hypothetical protein
MTTPRPLPALLPIILCLWAPAATGRPLPTCEPNDGTPFGQTTREDEEKLAALAAAAGVDLEPTLHGAYAGEADAIHSIFGLAMHFTELNAGARAYGNMLHSMFLNIGEAPGLQEFTAVLLRLDASTLQRIRDFLYYPAVCVSSPAVRAQAEGTARRDFPRIWPPEYVFGEGDRLFE